MDITCTVLFSFNSYQFLLKLPLVYLPQYWLFTSTILSLQLFPASELSISSTVKVACWLPEHVTDETGKINDGGILVIKVMQVSLADLCPTPINSPLITVVTWKV